jgi:hypothetical protein
MRRRLDRAGWVTYLRTGAVLALVRVSLLAWVEHRAVTHTMTEAVYNSLWVLYPEGLLSEYTRIGVIHFDTVTLHFLFWALLLTLGIFIITTPVLVVGWLRQRRG